MHVKTWELLEWGPVGIPDNPYAVNLDGVQKVLDRGRLDGRQIADPILRMLKSFAPTRRAYTKGIQMDDSEQDRLNKESETKAAAAAADEKPAGEPPKQPTPTDGGPDDGDQDDKPMPAGAA